MRQSETDMAEQIFKATEHLMAREGLHNLSTHKIAKEAKISAGTIYLYFKSKEELLSQFAWLVFSLFDKALKKDFDETEDYFKQYQKMWRNIWTFLQTDPDVIVNMQQYQSLPGFLEICTKMEHESLWTRFCQKAQQAEVLCNLPVGILFALSLESAIKLAVKQFYFKETFSEDILSMTIERTWRSIQK